MTKALICLLILMLTHAFTFAQDHEKVAKERAASLRFVQEFYDWYAPRASMLGGDPLQDALRHKRALFSPVLREALIQDLKAQQKAGDEIVGLDFDPFLNSQDPGERYVAVNAKAKGNTWLVSLYPVAPGASDGKPAVVAVVEKGEKGWRFVNFEYPGGEDLHTILRQLRKDR